jgi:hypothetical protein
MLERLEVHWKTERLAWIVAPALASQYFRDALESPIVLNYLAHVLI